MRLTMSAAVRLLELGTNGSPKCESSEARVPTDVIDKLRGFHLGRLGGDGNNIPVILRSPQPHGYRVLRHNQAHAVHQDMVGAEQR